MRTRGLLLRWALRDLRRRWVLVTAIALVLALGTGTYAALLGTSDWRRASNDRSFELLRMHDVRVTLSEGLTAEAGTLAAAVGRIPQAAQVQAVAERLILPTLVDVSSAGQQVLVPGRIVGMPVDAPVDRLSVSSGQGLRAGDPAVVLERSFADYYDLPDAGTLRVAGDRSLSYAGHGQLPEYFAIAGGGGGAFTTEAGFGVVFAPLETAQALADAPGRVNEVVLRLASGADDGAVAAALQQELDAEQLASTAVVKGEEIVYRTLYEDIEGDAQFWRIIAGLLLAGAAFATFNLTTRVVESQRREIGVAMALGLPRRQLAIRPLALGVQISVLGVLLGIGVGVVTGRLFGGLFRTLLPLPVWEQPFPYATYLQAAALGFLLPLLGVAWPTWRAIRVEPVEAIRVGHLAARQVRFTPLLRRLALPGRSYSRMPLRNLVRTPRRTVLTSLGVGAAIATLVAVFGILDSFTGTLDDFDAEATRSAPDRVTVQFADVFPEDAPQVAAVTGAPQVGDAATTLLVDGTARSAGEEIPLAVSIRDLGGGLWRPTIDGGGADAARSGIVLSQVAARDLGVQPGDRIELDHPQRTAAGFTRATTTIVVGGIHPGPIRAVAYLDRSQAAAFGTSGLVNALEVTPAAGVSRDELTRALFAVPDVASVQAATAVTDSFRDALGAFTSVLGVAAAVTLLLALLIAFNATSIATDERARENATMFAFGLPRRAVVTMGVVENAFIGLLGTAVGLGLGYLFTRYTVEVQLHRTLPEFGMPASVSPTTVVVALALGVGAVALTPLVTLRSLGRMDIPATLRVVE
ncbi:putative ABC transport system permease protein [Blastococcus aggregatus]|uniref:Putative ABC transport system permease protein n=1 Tax=Blastococcus aggregatus TaxID=38502 RepID=A0A285V3X1_9ACTN|nr:ABC transporter permease [Blastococcus aggregatus]SOC48750.1 putative ABC transport system permease protein [Blastococcus aggregatus]